MKNDDNVCTPSWYRQTIYDLIEVSKLVSAKYTRSKVRKAMPEDYRYIMDELSRFHSFDIQWGNHDVLWMGAYFGNAACMCNVIRINCVYRNLHVIENYGINLRPLVTFASEEYADDKCEAFLISDIYGCESDFEKDETLARMTKAITVIQLKLENILISEHPEYWGSFENTYSEY